MSSETERELLAEARALIDFYRRESLDPRGGFHSLGEDGRPSDPGGAKSLFITSRNTYSFALAHIVGAEGAGRLADHGLRFLRDAHRTETGFAETVGVEGALPDTLQLNGQAFVILAAAACTVAGRDGAREVLEDALDVVETRFWEPAWGMAREEVGPEGEPTPGYKGANSHMHLVEAYLCAADALGRDDLRARAMAIAERVIGHARDHDWRVVEHYDDAWTPILDYNVDDRQNLYRPYGFNIGHGFEWARLLLQMEQQPWTLDIDVPGAAVALVRRAIEDGWDAVHGGFIVSAGWDGEPSVTDRYWWTTAEAMAAASVLHRRTGDASFADWFERSWEYATGHLVDREHGGWRHQLDARNRPKGDPWSGKPDVYHALQACIVPFIPIERSIACSAKASGFTVA